MKKNRKKEITLKTKRLVIAPMTTVELEKLMEETTDASLRGVSFVEAETADDNIASQKVLSKLDFKPDGTGEEGPRFVYEESIPAWNMIYMMFGMSIGMALGTSNDHMSLGMCIGMALGFALGTMITSEEKKKREIRRSERAARKEAQ